MSLLGFISGLPEGASVCFTRGDDAKPGEGVSIDVTLPVAGDDPPDYRSITLRTDLGASTVGAALRTLLAQHEYELPLPSEPSRFSDFEDDDE